MSYGYLIGCKKPTIYLEKIRRHTFHKVHFDAGIHYYSRLEEGCTLTAREWDTKTSTLTEDGFALFNLIERPFFIMDFCMVKKEGDWDMIKKMQYDIKNGNTIKIGLATGVRLGIGKVYLVIL